MLHYAGAMLLGLWAVAGGLNAAMAQPDQDTAPRTAPVVVELFTSQGCAFCPPADALLKELSTRPDVLPLALHVDYWDYIGWIDDFAQPRFTKRQKNYARSAGRRMIYTPQMIVGGYTEVPGYSPQKVLKAIQMEKDLPDPVRIDLTPAEGGAVQVHLSAIGEVHGRPQLVLVRFRPLAEVEITRGENAGHTMTYANIVKDWVVLGDWDPAQPAEFTVPASTEDLPGAVLVQSEGMGPILSAARLD